MTYDPDILYEDPFLLCINKPAGLLSIRDGYDPHLPYVSALLEPRYGKMWIVHRLDRETSGVFLLARSPESHRLMNEAFEGRQVHKAYHAIALGHPTWDYKQANFPLKVDADRRHRTLVRPSGGKPAQTNFRVIKSSDNYTLLEAQPLSGYTHQIRAHAFALGFPILADSLYSLGKQFLKSGETQAAISRLALHAYTLEFRHPITGLDMRLTAPYPDDFRSALGVLSLMLD
jgi:RluA family pseudouridine synthase